MADKNYTLRERTEYKIRLAKESVETPGDAQGRGIEYPYGQTENWRDSVLGPYGEDVYDVGLTTQLTGQRINAKMEESGATPPPWVDYTSNLYWAPLTDGLAWNGTMNSWHVTLDDSSAKTLISIGDWHENISPTACHVRWMGRDGYETGSTYTTLELEEQAGSQMFYVSNSLTRGIMKDNYPNLQWGSHSHGDPALLLHFRMSRIDHIHILSLHNFKLK